MKLPWKRKPEPEPSRTERQLAVINANRADLDRFAAENLANRDRVMWTPGASGPCGLCGHPQGFHADDRDGEHGGRMMLSYYDGLCIVPDCHACDGSGYVPSQPKAAPIVADPALLSDLRQGWG